MMGKRVRTALAGLIGVTMLPAFAADGVELTTRVSGVVEEVLVSEGQKVTKGTLLLRLNPVILQARLDEAMADEDRAKADEADAKRELERAQELYERTVSSTTELDAASLAYARAQAGSGGCSRPACDCAEEPVGCRTQGTVRRRGERTAGCARGRGGG
jgi:multidrug efflux pump subunit AcrA (membrane-fusion protein)